MNPYEGISHAELCGRRKDYAKLLHAAVALKKTAEQHLHWIGLALTAAEDEGVLASDHAVIRFLERVEGVDIDAIRAEIGRRVRDGVSLGGDKLIASDGMIYVVNGDRNVVTVMPAQEVVDTAERGVGAAQQRTKSSKRARSIRRQRGSVELLKKASGL